MDRRIVIGVGLAAMIALIVLGSYKRLGSQSLDMNFYSLKNAYNQPNIVPVLIIGSGCAGYSAALYGARSSMKTVVFAGRLPGGQLSTTSHVENWPGLMGLKGPEIIKKVREQAVHFGAEVVDGSIKSINATRWPFEVITEDGVPLHALSIIIASGASPKLLGIPGEQEYWGKGVTTCAICDAAFHKDCDVIVSGGGDSAAEEAIQLSAYAKSITIAVRKDAMRASAAMQKRLQEIPSISIAYNTEITRINGNGSAVTEVELLNNKTGQSVTKKVTGVFLAIGHEPNTDFLKNTIALDKAGYIICKGRSQETSTPGIFAAGDVEDHVYKQAGVAAGSGIKAALDAASFLTDDLGFNESVAKRLAKHYFEPAALTAPALKEISSKKELEALQAGKRLILLDFYTEACPSCLQMMPIIQMLAHKYKEHVVVAKVNASVAHELAEAFEVQSVPVLKVLQGTKELKTVRKALGKVDLEKLFKEFVE